MGGPTFGKNSQIIPYFFSDAFPKELLTDLTRGSYVFQINNLSISTGSASCAGKEDWSEAFAIVVEVFDQQELLVQLKHGAGNFAEECCEASKFSQAVC